MKLSGKTDSFKKGSESFFSKEKNETKFGDLVKSLMRRPSLRKLVSNPKKKKNWFSVLKAIYNNSKK